MHSWNLYILILAVGILFLWERYQCKLPRSFFFNSLIYMFLKKKKKKNSDIHAIMLMLGLWNLFLVRLGLRFQGFLALLGFLIMILKTLMFDLWIFIHKFKRCFWWKIAKNCQKRLLENSKKFSYASFDQSRIPFDQSNVLFN